MMNFMYILHHTTSCDLLYPAKAPKVLHTFATFPTIFNRCAGSTQNGFARRCGRVGHVVLRYKRAGGKLKVSRKVKGR